MRIKALIHYLELSQEEHLTLMLQVISQSVASLVHRLLKLNTF